MMVALCCHRWQKVKRAKRRIMVAGAQEEADTPKAGPSSKKSLASRCATPAPCPNDEDLVTPWLRPSSALRPMDAPPANPPACRPR
eukprot:9264721-Pyramimonas_sp.AAC.1